jgi:hypothetical protein
MRLMRTVGWLSRQSVTNPEVLLDRPDALQQVINFLGEARDALDRGFERFEPVPDIAEFDADLRDVSLDQAMSVCTADTSALVSAMSCARAANPFSISDSSRSNRSSCDFGIKEVYHNGTEIIQCATYHSAMNTSVCQLACLHSVFGFEFAF